MTHPASTGRPIGHPALAALCAGPVFLLVLSIGMLVVRGGGIGGAAALLLVVPLAIPVGFVVAVIPNLICTIALHTLGKRNEATRLPVFWALIGALLPGGAALALTAPPDAAGLLAATGAVSALLCRIGVEWR